MNKEERVLKYINNSTELVFAEKYYCEADFYEDVENILKENQELKKQYKEYIRAEMKLKDELEKQRKEYQETYKDVREKIKEYKNQQKEFIEWLEKMSKDLFKNEEYAASITCGFILSKYKEIIGEKDE